MSTSSSSRSRRSSGPAEVVSSSSSSRLRNQESGVGVEEEDITVVKKTGRYVFDSELVTMPASVIKVPTAKSVDVSAWDKFTDESRASCIKAVVRLCLMKAGRKEALSRAKISDVLKALSKDYVKCLNSIVLAAKRALEKNFGLTLTIMSTNNSGSNSGGSSGSGTADYIVFNSLRSPVLQNILAETSPNAAWMGFVFVVLQCIHAQPGESTEKTLEQSALLRSLRDLDPRFPETTQSYSDKSNQPISIPELGADFVKLMKRMGRTLCY